MTPNLLDELEGVVRLVEKATGGSWSWSENGNIVTDAPNDGCDPEIAAVYSEFDDDREPANSAAICAVMQFLRTHAPTLADMAKRLEAAERKLSRLTGMRNEWERDAREHLMTFGQHLPASVECLVERFDAAIDATQEGEAG